MTTILYLYYFIINLTGAVLSRTETHFSIFSIGHISYMISYSSFESGKVDFTTVAYSL